MKRDNEVRTAARVYLYGLYGGMVLVGLKIVAWLITGVW